MTMHSGGETDNRRRIMGAVRGNPGVHMRELQRIVDMPTGLLKFHLDALERSGELTSQKDRYYRRYFPGGTLTGQERLLLACLRQSNPRLIVVRLMEMGEAPHKRLMEATGLKASTLSFYLKDMEDKGVVVKERRGRVSVYRVVDRDVILRVLRSYRPSFLDVLVDRFLQTWFER